MKTLALTVLMLIFAASTLCSGCQAAAQEQQVAPHSGVAVTSPQNQTYLPTEKLFFNASYGSVVASNLIHSITFSIDEGPWQTTNIQSRQMEKYNPLFGWIIGTTTLPPQNEGSHKLMVKALTTLTPDNRIIAYATTIVYFSIIDLTPPSIRLNLEGSFNSSRVPLNFTVNEPVAWAGYSLDWKSNETVTGNCTITVPSGDHTLTLYVNDTGGNMVKTSAQFYVQEAPQAGFFEWQVIAVFTAVAVAFAAVSVILKIKHKQRLHVAL